jgi:DNA-binding NtrC family response regulator
MGSRRSAEPTEAWNIFQTSRPQLLTLDIVMPNSEELGSLELFRRVRKVAPEVAVIVVSVSSSWHDRDKFMREGAIAFASKPFVDFDRILMQVNARHL